MKILRTSGNLIGSLRHICDFLLNGEGSSVEYNDAYMNWLAKGTAVEATEMKKQYDMWYSKTFEQYDKNDAEAIDRADEANTAIIGYVYAFAQENFEQGMKIGARLMLELLGF